MSNTASGTIGAAGTASYDANTDGRRSFCALVKNTGANALAVAVHLAPLGNLYAEDTDAAIASVAAGASALVRLADLACARVRLVLSSESGTTYEIEARPG